MTTESGKTEPTGFYGSTTVPLPRVAIKFCVQCKWNLRAAYYAQELLQTFSLSLGEVALIPSTSGTFVVALLLPFTAAPPPSRSSPSPHQQQPADATQRPSSANEEGEATSNGREVSGNIGVREHVLWDRKTDGGFPETKELKRRVRDLVEPGRGLGHVDRDHVRGVEKEKGRGIRKGKGLESRETGGIGERNEEEGIRNVDGQEVEGEKKGQSGHDKHHIQVRVPADEADAGIKDGQVSEKCEDCQN